MKIGWDICSSPPWVPFYPYTLFQNPISWPSHKKCRRTIITQKVLVTQSSNTVHCDRHTQKPLCTDLQTFANTFSLYKLMLFFSFLSGGVKETANISHCLDFDWEKASKWLEWHIFKVQGMPNPMLQVLSLCNKQFLKNHNFRQKFHILFILTGKNASKFRVWGMPNPKALVSLYDKWFTKITILRDT